MIPRSSNFLRQCATNTARVARGRSSHQRLVNAAAATSHNFSSGNADNLFASHRSVSLNANKAFGLDLGSRHFSTTEGENVTVNVPTMGESITEGTVVEWVKSPGEAVQVDDVVVVLETDKVSVDVRAPSAGIMTEHLAALEDTVEVGKPLFVLQPGEVAAADDAAAADSAAPATASGTSSDFVAEGEVDVEVPTMGESITEGTVVEWSKTEGDFVNADDVVVILETDKVSVDVRAPSAGRITKTIASVDDVVEVGAPLFKMETTSGAVPTSETTPVKAEPVAAPVATPEPAAPKEVPSVSSPAAVEAAAPTPHNRGERRVLMSSMRDRTISRMKDTQNTAALLTTFQECDIGDFLDMRNDLNEAFEKKNGVPLGLLSGFVKAASEALIEVPAVNSSLDDEAKEIVYHNYTDINIALPSSKGLVVPALRDTDKMSFGDIERNIADMANKAEDGSLAIEDMAGGTFSISNGGLYGSLMSTPMLSHPQAAVLGIHSIQERPMVYKGEVTIRPAMYLALTYDHRLIDGREAVTFLKSISDKMADPRKLLLNL